MSQASSPNAQANDSKAKNQSRALARGTPAPSGGTGPMLEMALALGQPGNVWSRCVRCSRYEPLDGQQVD